MAQRLVAIIAIIAIVTACSLPIVTRAATEATLQTHDKTKLMVLLAPQNRAEIVRPSELVGAVRSSRKTDRQNDRLVRFGSPSRVSRLLGDHAPEMDIVFSRDRKLTPEQVLQQYVLLEFDSPKLAKQALIQLRRDPDVLFAEHPTLMRPSVTVPTDPGANQGSYTSLYDYQWALGSLNLFAAWDKARGHAYIGHVDLGVYTGQSLDPMPTISPTRQFTPQPLTIHPDLSQSFRPQRTWSAINSQNMASVGNHVVVDDFLGDIFPQAFFPAARGHGTHTAGIIAGNNSFSGTRSGFQNPTSQGVSGVCWNCSLHVAKVNKTDDVLPNEFDTAAAIGWAISTGVQVINLSFGSSANGRGENYCNDSPDNVMCAALALAASRDVVFVASAGNEANVFAGLDFPASDSRTIAVGAIDSTGSRVDSNSPFSSQFGPGMLTRGLVAPGRDVLSTVYPGYIYNASFTCGDGYGRFAGQGYGPCSGTSMSAPFVTGIVALMRSVNPLLSASAITSRLLSASDRSSNRDNFYGAGKPNASAAIDAVLADTNRLTPLFSLQTAYPTPENPRNYLYTTVPQVGAAAYNGNFLPVEIGAGSYAAFGNPVAGFPGFPSGGPARAQTWIFTTHANPINPAYDLKPLYRLSRRCYVGALTCDSYSRDVDHYYASDYAEVQHMIAREWGHSYDGIEGYVYPEGQIPNTPQGTNYPQPANTVKLISGTAWIPGSPGYKHALYPEGQAPSGYIYLLKTLGYVYLNPSNGVKPTY